MNLTRCVLGGHVFDREQSADEVQMPNGWACGPCVDNLLFPSRVQHQADVHMARKCSANAAKSFKRFEEPTPNPRKKVAQ